MKIEVAEEEIIQSSVQKNYTQYLQMYYEVEQGKEYNLDIYMYPENLYKINQVEKRDCPDNCSEKGLCQKLECQCFELIAGQDMRKNISRDRCQYDIEPIFDESKYNVEMIPYQSKIIAIYLQQDDIVDDQQYYYFLKLRQIRNVKIAISPSINATIYFLFPFEIPYKSLKNNKLVFDGIIGQEGQEIDFSDKFESYHLKSANYSFVLILQNPYSLNINFSLGYDMLDNDNQFQDFILVIILSIVSFIILLVIIYIVKKRCENMQEKKNKGNQSLNSQKGLLHLMGIVDPAKDQECIICLDLLDQKPCRITPCKHILHEACLNQWLQKQQNCPICRETFLDDEGYPKYVKTRNQTTTFLNHHISQYGIQ
ncbi:unnamed protein product (macronuclear) [Paramecium tetraurelia]|uniref:RING-type domain-containing protein n=1 Tax=Paramecium tetraurelia TaxID=5888 RepID=A0CGH3_PARTE|nr:uncharacterized protein GSPATT00007330001 [Paramecium tetraurelia]CAK69890.1 unnamed protein product [Paramecium tetraurelia]|eukprot:XP_001437287.1 hypothetical protein (macronuclear) [Paramecium tetraurelia strain d4-2]